MMRLGPKGRTLIQSFEKCRLQAYQDERGVWTIGWGHTGPEVHAGLVWTQAAADIQFEFDVLDAEHHVISSTDVPLTQNQFDALVSFTFNIGDDAEAHSTLIKLVNARRFTDAANQFPRWDYSGGHVSAGLDARRAAERALFLEAA